MTALHVALIADCRYPIVQPFEGGLQAVTWHLARGLLERGVKVTICAAPGSARDLEVRFLEVGSWQPSDQARRDVSMPPEEWLREHHAYLELMMTLARDTTVDLVHNNSLHHLPVAMAEVLASPVLTTLHTPPTPWLESALRVGTRRQHVVAVSEHTASSWAHATGTPPPVIYNGVDLDAWPVGLGGTALVWTGRLCPEKGAHLAIDIARAAGHRLRVAGPVSDPAYFACEIEPRLGEGVDYVGHLTQAQLAVLVGNSAACLVTPCWDEPYGLVAAEALACGTPVLGFDRGGLPEVVTEGCGRLVAPDDVDAAAGALPEVLGLDRRAARKRAVEACSVDRMVDGYLELYGRLTGLPVAA